MARPNEILPGLWRFAASHPDWTEDEGGEDGWDQVVAWWAARTSRGLLLVDPLVADWEALDGLVEAGGGCSGVLRTVHWHQRSVSEAAERYGAGVWAMHGADERQAFDHTLEHEAELWDGIQAFSLERFDEVAVWLPNAAALLFGDAMLRRTNGRLRICPDSWAQPGGGPGRLRELLGGLARLPVEHVLVSHGPLVLGGGAESLREATS
jgi:hypothetical protein